MACRKMKLHMMHAQANVRNYYMQFEESQTQSLIDSKIMEFAQHARPPMVCKHVPTCTTGACHVVEDVLSVLRPAAVAESD